MSKRISLSFFLAIICAFSALMLFACGNEKLPESISFTRQEVEIFKGGSTYLNLEVLPVDANGFSLVWSSSNDKVASVKRNGQVSAKEYGSAVISCAVKGTDLVANCNVSVTDGRVYKVYVDQSNVKTTYYAGQTFDPTGLIVWARYESGVDKKLASDEYQIEVPQPLSEGDNAVIKCSNKTFTIELEVLPDVATGIVVSTPPSKVEYFIGQAFDPSGMQVSLVYASGKTQPVSGFDCQAVMFGTSNNTVEISYGQFKTTLTVTVKAKKTVYSFGQLQQAIDQAEVGDSIMLSGRHENVDTVFVPLEKQLTLVGGFDSVCTIMPKAGHSVFVITGSEQGGGSVTIANFELVAPAGHTQPLVSLGSLSGEKISGGDVTLSNIDFELFGAGIGVMAEDTFENVNLYIQDCSFTEIEKAANQQNSAVNLSGFYNGKICVQGCEINIGGNGLNLSSCDGVEVALKGCEIQSDAVAVNFGNIVWGIITIDGCTIKGDRALSAADCDSCMWSVDQSSFVGAQTCEIQSGVIELRGCNDNVLDIVGGELSNNNQSSGGVVAALVLISDSENRPSSSNTVNIISSTISFTGSGEKYQVFDSSSQVIES